MNKILRFPGSSGTGSEGRPPRAGLDNMLGPGKHVLLAFHDMHSEVGGKRVFAGAISQSLEKLEQAVSSYARQKNRDPQYREFHPINQALELLEYDVHNARDFFDGDFLEYGGNEDEIPAPRFLAQSLTVDPAQAKNLNNHKRQKMNIDARQNIFDKALQATLHLVDRFVRLGKKVTKLSSDFRKNNSLKNLLESVKTQTAIIVEFVVEVISGEAIGFEYDAAEAFAVNLRRAFLPTGKAKTKKRQDSVDNVTSSLGLPKLKLPKHHYMQFDNIQAFIDQVVKVFRPFL